MELNGEVAIAAPRTRVWAALNDPAVLARCIDGVERLDRIADENGERFEGRMNARVGPVRATFTGQVMLRDVVAPERYVIAGEGKGGVAGFARGEAAVTLAEAGPNATRLSYAATSSVGGKLAQLGARLIEGTARTYATTFFDRLKAEVEGEPDVQPAPAAVADPAPVPSEPAPPAPAPALPAAGGLSPLLWGSGLIVAVVLFLIWQWVA